MAITAKARYLRISPRKVNLVIKLLRGNTVGYALGILPHVNKRASLYLSKLLKSALSNAANKGIDTSDLNSLYISRLVANSGPALKRHRAASFGRANMIKKRTSHIEIELNLKK